MVNASRTAAEGDHRELMTALAALFANAFSNADGQYLKQVGDGCLALFADPDRALAFTRATRAQCATLGVELRSALNLGRVEFAHHEPIGPAIHATSRLLRAAPAGRTVCSEVAATLLGEGDDLVQASR
jgi:class 3 adenylate cyclase